MAEPEADGLTKNDKAIFIDKMGLTPEQMVEFREELLGMPNIAAILHMNEKLLANSSRANGFLEAIGNQVKEHPGALKVLDNELAQNGRMIEEIDRVLNHGTRRELGILTQTMKNYDPPVAEAPVAAPAPQVETTPVPLDEAPVQPAPRTEAPVAPPPPPAEPTLQPVAFTPPSEPAPPPADENFKPQRFEAMGMWHENPAEVKDLQDFLRREGFGRKLGPHQTDGVFGPDTLGALNAWQKSEGLPTTGPHEGMSEATLDRIQEVQADQQKRDGFGYNGLLAAAGAKVSNDPAFLAEADKVQVVPEDSRERLRLAQDIALTVASNEPAAKPDKEDATAVQQVLAAKGHDLGHTGPGGDGIDGVAGPLTDAALKRYQREAGLKPVGFLPNGELDPVTAALMERDQAILNAAPSLQTTGATVAQAQPETPGLEETAARPGPRPQAMQMGG